jgi:hypothetical protein
MSEVEEIEVMSQSIWIYINGFQYHWDLECDYLIIVKEKDEVKTIGFADRNKRNFSVVQDPDKIKISEEWDNKVLFKGKNYEEVDKN